MRSPGSCDYESELGEEEIYAVVRLRNFVTLPLVRLIQVLPSTAWRPRATLIDMN